MLGSQLLLFQRQRLKTLPCESVDKATYLWFVNARHKKIPLSHGIVKAKALLFAKELGFVSFSALGGWLAHSKQYQVHHISKYVCKAQGAGRKVALIIDNCPAHPDRRIESNRLFCHLIPPPTCNQWTKG